MLAAVSLSTLALVAAPQGPVGAGTVETPHREFAQSLDPDGRAFVPFVDAQGEPRPAWTRAAGAVDVDGDANPEAWFLGDDGSVTIGMAQSADLSRFTPYARFGATGFVDATTTRIDGTPGVVHFVDPAQPTLWQLDYVVPSGSAPRDGVFHVAATPWFVGQHAVALAAADPDGDGDDDLLVLREVRTNGVVTGAAIDCLAAARSFGSHVFQPAWTILLPAPVARIEAGDFDGDGAIDALCHLPGIGVFAVRAQGGSFAVVDGVALGAVAIHDLLVTDLDGDGSDDWIAVTDIGCLVQRRLGAGSILDWRAADASAVPLAGAALVDATRDGVRDLVVVPRDAAALTVHPLDGSGAFAAPIALPPRRPSNLQVASGLGGLVAIHADLDNDGDVDLLRRHPSATAWGAIAAPTVDLAPIEARVDPVSPAGPSGFREFRLRVELGDDILAFLASPAGAGVELEVGVFLEDANGAPEYWSRDLRVAPTDRVVDVPLQLMTDVLNLAWMRNAALTHWNGAATCGGPTILSIHLKDGRRRFASLMVQWDGEGDPNGSAVGVKWRVVAAPPLPTSDEDLLPWD